MKKMGACATKPASKQRVLRASSFEDRPETPRDAKASMHSSRPQSPTRSGCDAEPRLPPGMRVFNAKGPINNRASTAKVATLDGVKITFHPKNRRPSRNDVLASRASIMADADAAGSSGFYAPSERRGEAWPTEGSHSKDASAE